MIAINLNFHINIGKWNFVVSKLMYAHYSVNYNGGKKNKWCIDIKYVSLFQILGTALLMISHGRQLVVQLNSSNILGLLSLY